MEWLAQNGLMVVMTLFFLVIVLRVPIMGRLYGVEQITVHDLATRMRLGEPILLIDVRTPMEFANGHIQNARNLPLSELSAHIETLRAKGLQQEVLVMCRSGARSMSGAVVLKRAGFLKVYNVSGGMLQWGAQGYPMG